MAKQIYIDSNGNEVLVSGTITNDNNLPHFSGTPTAGTTAEAIADLQNRIQVKKDQLTGTTDSNGLISFAHGTRVIVGSVCSGNIVCMQIQHFLVFKNYNDMSVASNKNITLDYWYVEP